MKRKLKVVMLGEGRVGKTSLLHRFIKQEFDENCPSTVKANMYANSRMEIDGQIADVAVWDTAGQEKYHALGPIYYREADGAVLVYDITDKDSFAKVRVWLRELHQVVGDRIAVCVVGNKIDLERDRKVNKQEADQWCSDNGCLHVLCSAKLGIRVNDAFQAVVAKILEMNKNSASGTGADASSSSLGIMPGNSGRSRGVKVALDEPVGASPAAATAKRTEEKKGCCK